MQIETQHINGVKIAEIVANVVILNSLDDALDLLGNTRYQGFDKIIIQEQNIAADFFDLKTKLAGEILQKFTQYEMPLAIVGDFSKYNTSSLKDFITESNKGKQVIFVSSTAEAIQRLSKH